MSDYKNQLKDVSKLDKDIKIVIISSDFNKNYVDRLELENIDFLEKKGFSNIESFRVPGAFEIPGFTKKIIKKLNPDLIITLGVVVRGETTHYDYVAGDTARAIMDLTIKYKPAIIFGILTCENFDQVEARINPSSSISGLNLLLELQKLENI